MLRAIGHRKRKLILLLAIWLGAALALLPAVLHWQATPVPNRHRVHLAIDASYLVASLLCFWIYRVERSQLSRNRRFVLVFLIFLLANLTNSVHRFFVDHANIFPDLSNLQWQIALQNQVIALRPDVAPHSYRFLPNALVRWLELGGIGYDVARDIYRLIFGLLLYYAIYRFARLFSSYGGALITLLLVAAIYPISFEYYAGQLTDPMSHLSFVLAFIFLETGEFALLLTTLIIGSLAKETVLAMAGFYVLFRGRDAPYLVKSAILLAAAILSYAGVRVFVLHASGSYRYEQVSGVDPAHALFNWQNGRWLAIVALTAGALLPFLVLGWKQTAPTLKQLTFFLFPVLFISSLFFGWLYEGRNFMPLVFVEAVIAGNCLAQLFAEP